MYQSDAIHFVGSFFNFGEVILYSQATDELMQCERVEPFLKSVRHEGVPGAHDYTGRLLLCTF